MKGHFGNYGGQFVPETLMHPLEELEAAYADAQRDPSFQAELDNLFHNYSGRPTALYFAKRLTEAWGGAKHRYLRRRKAAAYPAVAQAESKEILAGGREP